jgi:hypothetical protein
MDRYIYEWIDRQDQMYLLTNGQKNKQQDEQTGVLTDRWTEKQTDVRQTGRQTDDLVNVRSDR